MLYARDSGDANFNVIGNTMAKVHGSGVTGNNQQQSPSRFELDLFDNIIASTSDAAVTLENVAATSPFAVRGGRNDFYANGKPNQLAGTDIGQHLNVLPRFVNAGAGNVQLRASSPMIDQGATCSPGGVAGPDAAGRTDSSDPPWI